MTRTERLVVLEALKDAVDDQRQSKGARYVEFRNTYRDDPAAFVYDCIDWDEVKASSGPADYQLEILDALPRHHRVSARGPHGLGKTALEAWALLWFSLVNDGSDWKALTTASAWRQLKVYLWPEVHKWSRHLRWDKIGRSPFIEKKELLDLEIKLRTGAASAVASSDHEKIEGAHADHLLFAYDEAKIIPDATWDASDGAFSTGDAYGLAVSTPGPPVGRFYDIHSHKPGFTHWWTRHVTLEEAIDAGRINAQWAEEMRDQWGEDSALYKNRVLGEFAESSADGIVPLAWVEAAVERWHEWKASGKPGTFIGCGVDVGEETDPTIIAPKVGDAIDELESHEGMDTMKTVAKVERCLGKQDPRVYAVVDAIGIGSGVVSRLRELGYNTVAFTASGKSERKDETGTFGFQNKRAEAWWNIREMLDPSNDPDLCLPPDPKMIGELTTPKYQEVSGSRIKVESKDEIRKRLDGRSTDRADAVIQILNEKAPDIGEGIVSVSKRRSPPRKSVWRR